MTRRLIALIFFCTVLFNTYSADIYYNGIAYDIESLEDMTVIVVPSDNKYSGIITIPSSIKYRDRDFQVRGIDEGAFEDCGYLTTVKINEGVEYLGEKAFAGCERLKSVKLPNSIYSLGEHSFRNCIRLASINIPEGIEKIPDNCFSRCHKLSSINFPKTVTEIGKYAFWQCISLKDVDLHGNIERIYMEAFANCEALTSIVIPTNVKILGRKAFGECSNLHRVILEDSEIPIKMGGERLYNYLKIDPVFDLCHITELYFGREIIDDTPYYGGKNDIGGIKELYILCIGPNIRDIRDLDIYDNEELTSIISLTKYPPRVGRFKNIVYTDCTVYVPEESLDLYKEAPNWNLFWDIQIDDLSK